MKRAIELALEGVRTNQGGPFGAVVVKAGAIIGEGCNRVLATNDPTAHAEIVAIRAASQHLGSFQLRGCELWTTCEPCPMCLAAAYWARLDAIYFAATRDDAAAAGFDDAFLYDELIRPIAQRTIPTAAIADLRAAASAAFAAWNAAQTKTPY